MVSTPQKVIDWLLEYDNPSVRYLTLTRIMGKSEVDRDVVANEKQAPLGFPLMWETDVLEMLLLLTRYGINDEHMEEAMKLVLSKRDNGGRWYLEGSFRGCFQVNIEQLGKHEQVGNSSRFGSPEQVIFIVWGPSAKLLSEDQELQDSIAKMKEAGLVLEACKA